MLSDSPAEIILAIAEDLTNRNDLLSFCKTSRRLHDIVVAVLYQRITLRAKNEHHLTEIRNGYFLPTNAAPNVLLRYTRHVEVVSTFHTKREKRCFHWLGNQPFVDKLARVGEVEDNHWAYRMAVAVLPVLEGLRDECLQSFAWKMGTCIPRKLLGPSGYLACHQSRIESLVLISGDRNDLGPDDPTPDISDLSAFTRLRKISWIGLNIQHMRPLTRVLHQLSHQLVEIELESEGGGIGTLFLPALFRSIDDDLNFVDPPVFTCRVRMFSACQILSLSGISMRTHAMAMAQALDFATLCSLTLRCCDNAEEFLLQSSKMRGGLRLKSLELQTDSADEDDPDQSIPHVLRSFRGLERLMLCTTTPSRTMNIWDALSHHSASLKAFTHHENARIGFRPHQDAPFNTHAEVLGPAAIHPLSKLNLEFIGLCSKPQMILRERMLSLFVPSHSLRVVHIRQSGENVDYEPNLGLRPIPEYPESRHKVIRTEDILGDEIINELSFSHGDTRTAKGEEYFPPFNLTQELFDLAKWFFSHDGLPSVQVLAFGDFSHEGRYELGNIVLVRAKAHGEPTQTLSFRPIISRDVLENELIEKYANVLSACPSTTLLDGWWDDDSR